MDKLEMAFTHTNVWRDKCARSPWGSWWTVVGTYPDDNGYDLSDFSRSFVEIVRAGDAQGAAIQARNERAWACEGGDSVTHLYRWFVMDSHERERVCSNVAELAEGCEVISVFEGRHCDCYAGPVAMTSWQEENAYARH